MKTRVTKWFDSQHAVTVFSAQALDYWRAPDLRKAYPKQVLWQNLKVTADEKEAVRVAQEYAKRGECDLEEVIYEFGESDLVEGGAR